MGVNGLRNRGTACGAGTTRARRGDREVTESLTLSFESSRNGLRSRNPPEAFAASALGELERAAGFGLAVLLALDHARVAGEEAAALEHGAQIRLVVHQRLGNAVAYRAGLARQAAARDRAHDVVLAVATGRHQRLLDQHAQDRAGEIGLDRTLVDGDRARARLEPHPRHRVLALSGGIGAPGLVELLDVARRLRRLRLECRKALERLRGFGHQAVPLFLRFMAPTSSASGCCAACGCSGPA